jgi:hypothetical protein
MTTIDSIISDLRARHTGLPCQIEISQLGDEVYIGNTFGGFIIGPEAISQNKHLQVFDACLPVLVGCLTMLNP